MKHYSRCSKYKRRAAVNRTVPRTRTTRSERKKNANIKAALRFQIRETLEQAWHLFNKDQDAIRKTRYYMFNGFTAEGPKLELIDEIIGKGQLARLNEMDIHELQKILGYAKSGKEEFMYFYNKDKFVKRMWFFAALTITSGLTLLYVLMKNP